jgi:GTPase Era involved in 16S rRNA processing
MYKKEYIPYMILIAKMLKIDDELFQNNASPFRRLFVTLGIVKIDMAKFSKDINSLYEKYKDIKKKGENKETGEFSAELEQAIISLKKVIEALYKKSRNIEPLSLNDYKILTSQYRLRKEEVLILLDELNNNIF